MIGPDIMCLHCGFGFAVDWQPVHVAKTSESGMVRPQAFCPRCGTAIYSTTVDDDPKACNVTLGVLRQRCELVPRRQIFARSQQACVNDVGAIPKFEKVPPR
jgi:hypothetical protein